MRLRVGQITLALSSRCPTPALVLPKRYGPFMPSRGSDIRLKLIEGPTPVVNPSDLVFESGGLWRVYRQGGDLLYAFSSPDGSNPLGRMLVIDPARRQGTLFLPPSRYSSLPGYALFYPLEEVLFQHHAAAKGSLVMHACGVAVGNKAFLFCGESGAGKTTMARLWCKHQQGAMVLSDDRVLLREHRGRIWAFGTPWHGSGRFASPQGRRLAAVFLLEHGAETRLEPLSEPVAVAQLFARTFPPMWEPEVVGRVLSSCSRLVREAPCHRLSFRPGVAAVKTILTQFAG